MYNKLIKVLWVEDDPEITKAYPREAEMWDIELHPFPCWEEAEDALKSDYNKWEAIILDAKCKYLKDDADKAGKFLSHVFPRIGNLAKLHNKTIPWYVLSGQGEDDIRDFISDTNEWDKDWISVVNRPFYSKSGKIVYGGKEMDERVILFHRIKAQVEHTNLKLQVEQDLYPDVFKSLEQLDLAEDVGYHLMELLTPIHFKDIAKKKDYNRRYTDLRKSLEYMFRHMVKKEILPPIVISTDIKAAVRLSWCSLFLGASQPEPGNKHEFWEKVKRHTKSPILPEQLVDWLKNAVFQTGSAVHTSDGEVETSMNFREYLASVGESPYMLRSLTMGLCDFILWYGNFIKNRYLETTPKPLWTLITKDVLEENDLTQNQITQ